MTGEEWMEHFRKEDSGMSDYSDLYNIFVKYIEPSSGEAIEVVILEGKLWDDNNRTSENIRTYAMEYGFSLPTVELSCLIRDYLSAKDLEKMGISILVPMHEPITDDSWAEPHLICVQNNSLYALYHYGFLFEGESVPKRWARNDAFAFIKSRVSAI